jgi:TRAP-type C4-dicarboxylate transport system substrate-binding protein
VLTGHIVDHLNTIISKSLWKQLSEDDRKIFTEVAQEAAERATKKIQQREVELIQFFKDKGLDVVEVNKQEFIDAVQKNVSFDQFGYRKEDWDRIEAIKSGS